MASSPRGPKNNKGNPFAGGGGRPDFFAFIKNPSKYRAQTDYVDPIPGANNLYAPTTKKKSGLVKTDLGEMYSRWKSNSFSGAGRVTGGASQTVG